ncbi:MAG TPA: class I SAM-dependent methyltransferase [Planctomicrobium sp.]|nr:class I SAM-dependent methyltransferase [Planctomicrobium sp.]
MRGTWTGAVPVLDEQPIDEAGKTAELPLWVRCRRFLLTGTDSGQHLLDVGCGHGELMSDLLERGCHVQGVEIDPALVEEGKQAGRNVVSGVGEKLPVADESVDGIVCSVVLPYTDERRVIAEFARVLKPGGFANITGHGVGYGLRMMIGRETFPRRLYGIRMLVNTLVYRVTGKRLPGIPGDTLCQQRSRMRLYLHEQGLQLEEMFPIGTCAGFPEYLAVRVRKPAVHSQDK